MVEYGASLLQRSRTTASVFFHRFGIHCATHQIRLILISSVVITSLFYPALAIYSTSPQSSTHVLDSFLRPSAVSGFYAQHDLRNIWEGHPALRVVEDAVSRAKCGKQRTLRVERVLIQNSPAENSDLGALNYQILKSTLSFEQSIAKQVAAHGCLKRADGDCFVLSPLAFWHQSSSDLHADVNVLNTLNLSNNATVAGIPVTPHMVLAGRGSFDYEQADTYDYADYLALTFFFPDSDCLGSAEHEVWHDFVKAAASGTREPTQTHEPTLIALKYDTSHTRPSHFSPISLFLYFAYLAFFIYVARSMRDMVSVHSRIGLTFTALVEIAVSTVTSLSVCALVGFRITMVPWELLPIVIVFVGAENMFSLVNAVTQTSVTLPVKERIAVGLSHAGTSNTLKVLSYNIILGTLALFASRTGAGAITQFCIFAIVVLIAHWFLAHTFFLAVLSIDIQRLELSELLRQNASLAPTPAAQGAKHSDSDGDSSSQSRWESFLGAKRGFFRRRFTKDFSLVLLLAITATLYYTTSPVSPRVEAAASMATSRSALSKSDMNVAPGGQDYQSAAWLIWKTLNPSEDPLLHLRIEMPTILTFGPNTNPNPTADKYTELDHGRAKPHHIRTLRRVLWFAKIVILPIAATTTALYFLCLHLLKDAELLEAQRNRAEPPPISQVEETPLEGRVFFTTIPRAFPTDVELIAASTDGRVIASVGMQNELVVIWRRDHDKQTVIAVDTTDILLRPASSSAAASTITALCMNEQGSFCAVGTGAGIIAVWAVDDGKLSPFSHFTQDNSSAGVVDLLFVPKTKLPSLVATYENGTAVRWRVNGKSAATHITPNNLGPVIKCMAVRVQSDNRLLVAFAMANGTLEVNEVTDACLMLVPDCVLRAGNPTDTTVKLSACSFEMGGIHHLIIGAATEAGIISLWNGQTGECMYVFEDAFMDMGSLRLSPVICEMCHCCGEHPPESFTVSFSAGSIVLFYTAYVSAQARRCSCAHNVPRQGSPRDISFGKRSRTTSSASAVGSISPSNIRSRIATMAAVGNQLVPDISSFPVSAHGVHSRRASEKDSLRRTENLTLPCLPDDMDPSQSTGPLDAWPPSPISRASAAWNNLVVARIAKVSCERGSWDVSAKAIVGIYRKARSHRVKGVTTLPLALGVSSSQGLQPAALDRWELWTFDPSSARIQSAPLSSLVDAHPIEPRLQSSSEPPRLPFTRVSPFVSAGSHGLVGLGNTIGVFNLFPAT